ncbi:MAG: hypothetical protein QOG50_2296 [Actinomycetota bacterium]|nr:hypothetical protein [Actinomycetota bacterium]
MERAERSQRPCHVKRVTSAVALVVLVTACSSSSRSSSPGTSIPRNTTTPQTTAADRDRTADDAGEFPGFLPAAGWETAKTPETSSATAANVALGPNSLAGSMPWDTVERLEDGDVVLFAMLSPAVESAALDANFPRRELPLSLDDTVTDINYNFEGQPNHIYADRVEARVNGWNIDLLAFYGGGDRTAVPPVRRAPSAETRAAAQEQLARLVVPAPRTDG